MYDPEDFYGDGYYYGYPGDDFGYGRNSKNEFINDNFSEAVSDVIKKARRTLKKGNGEFIDQETMKQIFYWSLIFSIKIILFLAIKDAAEKGCEPLL